MTITNIERDRKYPMPGETVTLSATYDAGTRVRFKLLSKPAESKLEVFDDAHGNYLVNSQLVPDVPGSYYVCAVEELFALNAPRFSNDVGPASDHGTPGELRGVEQVTPLPATLAYVVPVCQRVTRQIGFGDDTAEIEFIATTSGSLTRTADATLAPKLSGVTSTMGKSAQSDAGVLLALRELGGADYGVGTLTGTDPVTGERLFVYRANEDAEILPWESIIEADPLDAFRRTRDAFNGHVLSANDLRVHNVADNVNAAPALAGTSIGQIAAFLDAFVLVSIAHAAHAAHPTADAILSTALSALVPLGGAPSLDALCARTNLVWDLLDDHLVRIYLDASTTPQIHLQPGDNRLDSVTYPKAVDATTSHARCGALKSRYDDHRLEVQPYNLGVYHATAGTSAEAYSDTLPEDRDSFVAAVGTLATCVVNHLENMSAAGISTGYHAQADHGSVVSAIRSKPTDFASAVTTLEALDWALARHALKGSPTHAIVWPGACRPAVRGMEALQHAWLTAVSEATAPIGANMVYASGKLAQFGGWKAAS